jgi:hypothetical protein
VRLQVPNATKVGRDRPRKVTSAGNAVFPRGLPIDLISGLNVTTFEYEIAVTHQRLVRLFGRPSSARPTMESMPL